MLTSSLLDLLPGQPAAGVAGAPPPIGDTAAAADFSLTLGCLLAGSSPTALTAPVAGGRQIPAAGGKIVPAALGSGTGMSAATEQNGPGAASPPIGVVEGTGGEVSRSLAATPAVSTSIDGVPAAAATNAQPRTGDRTGVKALSEPERDTDDPDPPLAPELAWLMPPGPPPPVPVVLSGHVSTPERTAAEEPASTAGPATAGPIGRSRGSLAVPSLPSPAVATRSPVGPSDAAMPAESRAPASEPVAPVEGPSLRADLTAVSEPPARSIAPQMSPANDRPGTESPPAGFGLRDPTSPARPRDRAPVSARELPWETLAAAPARSVQAAGSGTPRPEQTVSSPSFGKAFFSPTLNSDCMSPPATVPGFLPASSGSSPGQVRAMPHDALPVPGSAIGRTAAAAPGALQSTPQPAAGAVPIAPVTVAPAGLTVSAAPPADPPGADGAIATGAAAAPVAPSSAVTRDVAAASFATPGPTAPARDPAGTGQSTTTAFQAVPMPAPEPRAAAVADALRTLGSDADLRRSADVATAAVMAAAPVAASPLAVAGAGQAPHAGIDLTREPGLHRMIDRIEQLRDAADARDTRIRLVPDSLGPVEIAVRREGEAVRVHFTAAEANTRQLIADAQPRLTELAEARGVRIERATVDAGAGQAAGGDAQARSQSQTPPRPQPVPPRAPARAPTDATLIDSTDERIA